MNMLVASHRLFYIWTSHILVSYHMTEVLRIESIKLIANLQTFLNTINNVVRL